MTEKELRKLNRYQLLELLMMQTEENRQLQQEVERLRQQQMKLDEMGSVAEASLLLNGVFEAAQKAADDYVNEARDRAQRIVERARLEAEIFNETATVETKNTSYSSEFVTLSHDSSELRAAQQWQMRAV